MNNPRYLEDLLDQVMSGFEEIKRQCKDKSEPLYEQWKAGGFAVDGNFLSMYPAIEEVVEGLIALEMEDEDENDLESEE